MKRLLITPLLLLFLSLPTTNPALPASDIFSIHPETLRQGGVLLLTIKANSEPREIGGTVFAKPIHFYHSGKEYRSIVGIDLDITPGEYPLSLYIVDKNGVRREWTIEIEILDGGFGLQRLTLPEKMVKLDEETLKRVALEKRQLDMVWHKYTERPLWKGKFIMPVKGRISSKFGLKRIINGEPKNSHTGLDIAAPEGTPVSASNRGKVIFVGDLFYTGNTLIIDHGLGLYTMYSHLSEVSVNEGDEVKKGQTVGRVGKTGRATGPHLHWGIRLDGSRINPVSLVNLSLK